MGLKIIRAPRLRAGYGKKGNPHMEGQSFNKRGKWNPKTKRYDPVVLDPEKKIVDKKKPYKKKKNKVEKKVKTSQGYWKKAQSGNK